MDPLQYLLLDDGVFPNNARLPLLVYPGALASADPAEIEALFAAHGWGGAWRNGVYGFQHYHSTAHEALGCYGGEASVQLGGERGVTLTLKRGDVVVIPAGVAHKNLGDRGGFRVVGAYPQGTSPDMNRGRPEERPRADQNVAALPLPESDPLFGAAGPLVVIWTKR